MVTTPYIRPGISGRPPLPKLLPAVHYDVGTHSTLVFNAYTVREVLKAAGYQFVAHTKNWSKKQTLEAFRDELPVLEAVGVKLDAETAHLLAMNATPEPEKVATPATVATAESEGWTSISPASAAKLEKARNRLIILADSMRIAAKDDRDTLREIAATLFGVLKEAAA